MPNDFSEQPNILVIMSDQHNPKVMGCAGDSVVRTPNINKLSQEGMRFNAAYTPCPVCVPARSCFMTGRRPSENKVTGNYDILSSRILTWPARLREAGYHAALIGRMHFEGPDQFHGFETTIEDLRHWRKGRPVENQYTSNRVPLNCYWSARTSIEDLAGSGRTFVQYRDELICDHAVSFLKEQAQTGNRPFAAVIGFYQPHPPYIGPREIYEYYQKHLPPLTEQPAIPDCIQNILSTTSEAHLWRSPAPIDPVQVHVARAAYYANIEHLDGMVGRVLDAVESNGLRNNTLVIYCSDHGEMLGRMGAWGKVLFFEDSVRIPLIVRFPEKIESGVETDCICNLRDLPNTFCDLANAAPLQYSDGQSLWPLLTGKKKHVAEYAESEITFNPIAGTGERVASKMVRKDSWKLCVYWSRHGINITLHNLDNDPDECCDLSNDSLYTSIKDDLLKIAEKQWDPEHILAEEQQRILDRQETNSVWKKIFNQPGYAVPEDIDVDVNTPHTRRLPSG